MILLGQAGSGKSFCINIIRSILKEKVDIAAYTAAAGFVVKGDTIHSLVGSFGDDSKRGRSELLKSSQLNNLQRKFENVTHVIFDEFSMINFEVMHIINKRL